MKEPIKRIIVKAWCAFACIVLTPALALAQDDVVYNAKLEGYKGVKVDDSGAALTWLLLVGLSMLAVAVMFKNAKRTHLD